MKLTILSAIGFLSVISFAKVRLAKEEVGHFMAVVDTLQAQLAIASESLNTPMGVRDFREYAEVLRLHQAVLTQEESQFARFLYETGWWVNRNLGLADGEENYFEAMFQVLQNHSDVEIAADRSLQGPLIAASRRIEGTMGLEVAHQKPEPIEVVLTPHELEAAVAMAALGVVTLPNGIAADKDNIIYQSGRVSTLDFFVRFLSNSEVAPVLRKRMITSLVATTAAGIVDNVQFGVAVTNLTAAIVAKDLRRSHVYSSQILGIAGAQWLELSDEFPPSQRVSGNTNPSGGALEPRPAGSEITRSEAEKLLPAMNIEIGQLRQLFQLVDLHDANSVSRRAFVESAFLLQQLLEHINQSDGNHLSLHFHRIDHFSYRNYVSMARGVDSVLKRLRNAIVMKDSSEVDRLIGSIESINMLESVVMNMLEGEGGPELKGAIAQVDSNDQFLTEAWAVMFALVSPYAIVVPPKFSEPETFSPDDMVYRTETIRNLLVFLMGRLHKVLDIFTRLTSRDLEYERVKVLAGLLGKPEQTFAALDKILKQFKGLATVEPMRSSLGPPPGLQEGIDELYRLLTEGILESSGPATCLDPFRKP